MSGEPFQIRVNSHGCKNLSYAIQKASASYFMLGRVSLFAIEWKEIAIVIIPQTDGSHRLNW